MNRGGRRGECRKWVQTGGLEKKRQRDAEEERAQRSRASLHGTALSGGTTHFLNSRDEEDLGEALFGFLSKLFR